MKRDFSRQVARGAFSLLLFLFLLPVKGLLAQAPDSINYQAVARDDQGKVLSGASIDVRMRIYSDGNLVYEEEHTGITTNQFGLFDLYIGGGNQTGGSASGFDAISWGQGAHEIEVAIDVGQGYESLGQRKFVSVPYALYADSSGSGSAAGSLQSAYKGGNTITLDTSSTPVRIESGTKPHLHVDSSAVRMGHTNALKNTQLDVRYDAAPTPGPAIMGASAPVVLPNSAFSGQAFQENNAGVFGVGVGTRKAIGVTGFSVHNSNTPPNQDSVYGVTGIALDRVGKTSAGMSAIARAYSNNVKRSVGIYSLVDDEIVTDYQDNPMLAGGVFEANIDPGHTDLDSTIGVAGLGGFGGDTTIGVYGIGRGDPSATGQISFGVAGQAGFSPDTNVGVLGQGNGAPGTGKSIAAWFRGGKTIVEDTLQVPYGNPSAGEVLTAVDNQGNVVWSSGGGGGTVSLQNAYDNGDSIALASSGRILISDSTGTNDYLYAVDGNPSAAVGHRKPIGSTGGGVDVPLHVAKEGPNNGQLLISAGDNSGGYDAALSLSENIGSTLSGAELRYHANLDYLILGGQIGGGDPILGISTGIGSQGVLIGDNYLSTATTPPQNGMLVQDTVGIGTNTPAHKHHIEGRTFSREGMLVDDTAHYRYDAPKRYHEGVLGAEMRPSGNASTNRNYVVTTGGRAYFTSTITSSGVASAPLDLPDGAVVDSIIYHVYDTNATNSLDLSLERVSYGGSSSSSTISGTAASSSGVGAETLYGIPANPLVIDNKNYMYQLVATFPVGVGTDIQIANIRISYTVRKAE